MRAVRKLLAVIAGTLIALSSAGPADAALVLDEPFETNDWLGWTDVRESDILHTSSTRGFVGEGLHVTIPTGSRRGVGPEYRFPDGALEEAWFRYVVRLDDWQAQDSGKLPGLAGLYSASARGCRPSSPESPGWSARMLFEETGTAGAEPERVRIGYYTYHLDQPGPCGEFMHWSPLTTLDQDRWYCLEGHVRLNRPGRRNGILEGWVDGVLAFRREGLAFRRAAEPQIGIRSFWMNVFYGGDQATPNPLDLTLDQVVVSTDRRVGCVDPFLDDQTSPHEQDINELHARSYLFGCAELRSCPENTLTRAEAAAFFSRVLDLPPAPGDAFADDEGHWGEDVINRLAAARITTGCEPGRFCPDATITRAEMAAMLRRAYGLPYVDANRFVDDDGHWAERDIDAVAAARLTRGCDTDRYCPGVLVTRAQAATLFRRAIDVPG